MFDRRMPTLLLAMLASPGGGAAQADVEIVFAESADAFVLAAPPDLVPAPFNPEERQRITRHIRESNAEARRSLTALRSRLRVTVARVDRDLEGVGGVSGRADASGEVLIELSTTFPGGLPAQLPALRHALLHELHHLARGWTIRENRYGPGIATAAVNEGLAEVFAEGRTGRVLPVNEYPEEVHDWAREILALPTDAEYSAWMLEHPDGRLAVGYRTGRYIVHRAMARSGLTVLDLTERSPEEILGLAGLLSPPERR